MRRFRSTEQAIIITGFALLVVAAGAVQGFRLGHVRGSIEIVADLIIAGVMVGGPARAAVYTTDAGVRIRNLFSSRTVSWGEIRRFRIGRYHLLSKVCIVDLIDGGSVHASGISVPNRVRNPANSAEQRMIDELNSMLEAHRAPAQPSRR